MVMIMVMIMAMVKMAVATFRRYLMLLLKRLPQAAVLRIRLELIMQLNLSCGKATDRQVMHV